MKTTIINKILLVLMLITAQQVSALEFQVDGIYYRTSIFTKNSAYVTHSGTSYTESVEYQGEVVIPESVTYNGKTYTIASIGGYAFAGCPGLTSVTIPNTVTTINQNAFNGCTGLKIIECKATTPPALGDNAFTSYDATLVVPSSSESAYKSAAGWSNFKFKEESSETPGSGENSGEDSGSDNSGSDNTYGLACKIINSTDVEIVAGSEKYTGDIVIPSQVTISGKTYTVTSIADDAFKGCTGLTSITIPSSITSIGSSSFDSCNNLNKVNISDILSWCKITFANSLANPLYYAKKLYLNGTLVTKLEIPSAITEIKNYTFYNCTSISTIVFPSGILKIGNSAFVNCSNLTSVTIPNSVTTIDENAFNGCTGLASLTIGSSVGSIGNYAFGNCTGLKSVTSLNSTPPTCGTGVFQGVTISSIPLTVPAGSESLYKATYTWQDFKYKEESENPGDDPAVDTSGLKYNIISSTDVEVIGGTEKYTGDIVIPSQTTIDGKTYNVTKIGIQAFNGCAGLTSITIPNSVYIIADESIYDCSALKSITIPSSVTSIGNYVLSMCPSLTSIVVESGNVKYDSRNNCNAIIETSTNTLIAGCKKTVIPSSVSIIGTAAFNGSTGLTSITIPSSVVSLGEGAFFECTGLTSISIPNSVTSIGENVFAYCENLKTVTLSNKIKTISFSAFSGCYSLTGIEIPNSVTTIDEEAFSYCESITNITIGENVNSIGKCAFMSCNGLSRISTLNPTPPTCGENVFKNVNVSNVTLTVPTGSVSIYKSADIWKDFKYEQTEEEPSEPELPTDNSGLSYNILNSTEVEVIAGAEKYTGDIVIPSQTTIDGKVYNVTKVGFAAFHECTGLTNITIPNSVTSIGSSAFSGCSGLTSIVVESGNTVYDSRNNCNAIIETSTNTLITGCKNTIIPNSVTNIGENAFYGCIGLTSISIPSSVTSIGNYAFSGCIGLTSITIPNGVTSIGTLAFSNCSGLTRVISLSTTPPTCGTDVFYNVSVGNITLEVPAESVSMYQSADIWKDFGTIKGIGESSALTYNILNETDVEVIAGTEKYTGDIVIPSQTTIDGKVYNVTKVGEKAFYGCDGLTSITIPNSVTSISNYAYFCCTGLTSVTIPNSVTSIGNYAFSGCNGLTIITIPNSVTSIGRYAFDGCSGLTNVIIPNSVTSIGEAAFAYCSGLTSIVVESGNTVYDSRDNCNAIIETSTSTLITGCKNTVIPNSITSIGNYAFYYCSGLISVTIPNSVTRIGDYAFASCSGLTSVTIPNSVTSIGYHAFYYCSGLTSITIPNSVTIIGIYAFYYCSKLTSVTIGNSVASIGSAAFSGCSGLTSITIPNSVTDIGHSAFYGCSGLTSVTSLNPTPPTCGTDVFYNVSVGNITLEVPAESVSLYQSADTWKDFGTIKGIGESSTLTYNILNETDVEVVAGTEKYTSDIVIPSQTTIDGKVYNVTQIGDAAFQDCTNLTSVTIPNSVTSIGYETFSGCSGLSSITIPNSVTSIGNSAFLGCSGLTSITIPSSVTSISDYAFYGCSSLTSIIVESGNTVYDSRNNCNAIIETSTNTLITGCKNTIIPNSVTRIGGYAFLGCIGLTSITIPNSVTSIGEGAFRSCRGLTSITIPNSVTSIGEGAFRSCRGLTSVTSLNPTPPTCGTDVFYNVSLGNITLEVPAESVSMYQSADIWKDFGSIKGIGESSALTYNILNETDVEVVAGTEKYTGDIVIPSQTTIDGKVYNVTSIGNTAFAGCYGLTSVTIPNSVTSIGDLAFNGCSGLTSITIPSSVTSIGDYAFNTCIGLTSVTIPSSVISLGRSPFSGCDFINSFVVESGNTKYDSRENCNAIIETSTNSLIQGCENTVIPNSVTGIGEEAFAGCMSLTSITIPNSVTSIGSSAFSGCMSLTSITIPNSVTSIGNSAFSFCSLTSIIIPSSVTSIGGAIFADCYGLTSIIVASGNTIYDSRDNCNAIIETSTNKLITGCENTVIPNSVTGIGDNAFSGCSGLTSISIPSSVTSIGNFAFFGCSGLISIISLNPTPPTCGSSVFYNVSVGNITLEVPSESVSLYQSADTWKDLGSIKGIGESSALTYNILNETDVEVVAGTEKYTGDIVIPSQTTIDGKTYNVTKIGFQAFNGCAGLTSITIPNSVTYIEIHAFSGCSGLISITIPNSVNNIGNSAFRGCIGLTSVTIGNSVTNIGNYAFDGCSGLTSITIGNCVTSIGISAFRNCSGLISVTIPNSVTSIGDVAFYGCRGLTSITIPNSVNNIGNSAFSACSGLTSVTIPDGVTSIGEDAFSGCRGLTSITIPNSVTSIGQDAFASCSGLTSIIVESGNTVYDSRDNCNAIIETSTNTLITGCKNTVIPNSVTSIGDSAFSGCSGLTSVTIPDGVTSIGEDAFSGCRGLTSITIPNSVTSIGQDAFASCSGLTSIVIESGNTQYDSRNNCNAIIETSTNTLITGCKNTVIPNSVISIRDYAFSGCSGLTNITIPNSVTSIGNYAFSGCSGLISVTIPNSVTSIGDDAFSVCSSLTSITIPNSVTSIGSYAFRGCSGLTSVTIGNSVTSIGKNAFSGCSGLISIISLNPTPPTCGTDVFYNVRVGNITLEVPSESVSLYQSADVWKDFGTITAVSSASRSESSGIDDILADDDEVEYYNLQGVRVMNPEKGIYIKRQGGKTSKVVL